MATDYLSNPAARQREIRDAWAAYDGDAPRPLKVSGNGASDNVRVNLFRFLVDSYTSWTFGREWRIESDDTETTTDVEALIESVWPADKRQVHMLRARTEGGVTRDAFLRVIPGRVIVLPTENVTVIADPMDAENEIGYVIETEIPASNGQSDILRQTHLSVDGAWVIRDEMVKGGRVRQVVETPWPFAKSQIVHIQNRTSVWTYGEGDATSGEHELISSIERALSNAAKISRLHASPRAFSKNLNREAQEAVNKSEPGSWIHLGDAEQELGLVEAGAAGLESTLALADKLVAQFYGMTGLPDPESADGKLGDTSGAALELRLATMLQRIEGYRRTYGRGIAEVCDRLQLFAGLEPVPVRVVWSPVLPENRAEKLAYANGIKALGASNETVWREAGLDPAVEAARLEAERPADIGGILDRLTAALPE